LPVSEYEKRLEKNLRNLTVRFLTFFYVSKESQTPLLGKGGCPKGGVV
jgi:hypothetical protein